MKIRLFFASIAALTAGLTGGDATASTNINTKVESVSETGINNGLTSKTMMISNGNDPFSFILKTSAPANAMDYHMSHISHSSHSSHSSHASHSSHYSGY